MADIADELTTIELQFLPRLGLAPEDVMDVRHLPSSVWKRRIREQGKKLALGARCQKGGHRLRTTSGHCVQCDIRKYVFGKVFSAEQYVYIAGSRSAQLFKFGTCTDCDQREVNLQGQQYGGIDDWQILYCVKVRDAGRVERAAHMRLAGLSVLKSYWKDGVLQDANELLKCSYNQAKAVLEQVSEDARVEPVWVRRSALRYDFNDTGNTE